MITHVFIGIEVTKITIIILVNFKEFSTSVIFINVTKIQNTDKILQCIVSLALGKCLFNLHVSLAFCELVFILCRQNYQTMWYGLTYDLISVSLIFFLIFNHTHTWILFGCLFESLSSHFITSLNIESFKFWMFNLNSLNTKDLIFTRTVTEMTSKTIRNFICFSLW